MSKKVERLRVEWLRLFLAFTVMLLVGQPVMGQTSYRESLRVNENGEVVALDSSGNSNKAPVFAHGVGANRTNIGSANKIWIAQRTDSPPCVSSICGSGTELDPIKVTTSAAFQTVLTAAPAASTIHMEHGTYTDINLTITKSVKITGDRRVILTQATGAGKPIFALSGASTEFILEGVTLQRGTTFRSENSYQAINVVGAIDKVKLLGIYTSDFNNTFLGDSTVNELIVRDSEFVYTYGRAGISNVAPYLHPCASIAGSFIKRIIVQDNIFDGLLDSTFAGITGSPPVSQQVPADNFVQTGFHDYADISGNTVRNHYIEGIYLYRTSAAGTYSYRIANNHTVGSTYARGDWSYAPGIVLRDCQADVVGNTVANTPIGINASFTNYDEALNVVTISGNTIEHVLHGIIGSNVSSKTSYNGNTIWNTSEPSRTVFGQAAPLKPTEFWGIKTNRGTVTNNVLLADEPDWAATTTITSRASNVFTLASATGMATNGLLISYANSTVSLFPVTSVSGNNVTVDAGWAAAAPSVTSGTLYYASSYANPQGTGGIVVLNGGTIYAENNTVIGHIYDVSQLTSGTIVLRKHSARNCHYARPDSASIVHEDPYLLLSSNLNNHAGQPFYIERFNDTSQPANEKILDFVIDIGAFYGRMMNDDLTQRVIPFSFTETLAAFSGGIQANAGNITASGNITAGGNIQAGGTGSVTGYTISAETTVAGDGSLLTNLDARRVSANARDVADTDTTLTTDDYIVRYTTLTAARVVTLPSAASANGVFFIIKDLAGTATANPITFASAVEGSTDCIDTDKGVCRVQSNGTIWYRL